MDNTMGTEWLLEQNGIINFERNGIIKKVTIRWRTSKECWLIGWHEDRRPFRLVFWLTQKVTSQLGLLIDPKSDSSVSKVVQQLPYWIEALQESKVIPKQPLKKVDTPVCE
jgi:hypothetical protein